MSATTEIRERPILFSGPMVRAILDGSKTQTRRVAKWKRRWPSLAEIAEADAQVVHALSPYGQPGDLLYVRESFAEVPTAGGGTDFVFAADYTDGSDREAGVRYEPSIFMPKRLSRIWLRVTDVRVERVQEITVEDIRAEGVRPEHQHGTDHTAYEIAMRVAFRDLWDSITADRGYPWSANPWVWVVTFERTEAP